MGSCESRGRETRGSGPACAGIHRVSRKEGRRSLRWVRPAGVGGSGTASRRSARALVRAVILPHAGLCHGPKPVRQGRDRRVRGGGEGMEWPDAWQEAPPRCARWCAPASGLALVRGTPRYGVDPRPRRRPLESETMRHTPAKTSPGACRVRPNGAVRRRAPSGPHVDASALLAPRAQSRGWSGAAVLLEGVVLYCLWCAVRCRAGQRRPDARRPGAALSSAAAPDPGPKATARPGRMPGWRSAGNDDRRKPNDEPRAAVVQSEEQGRRMPGVASLVMVTGGHA